MSGGVTVTGLDETRRQIDPQRLQRAIGDVVMAVGLEAQDRIAKYPPQSHAKQAFKTAKQRRGFFAKLRAGEIQVPYVRGGRGSETLGRRWHIRRESDTRAVLENDASYADLVVGSDQSAYMAAEGWKDTDTVAAEIQNSGVIERIAGQVLAHIYGG